MQTPTTSIDQMEHQSRQRRMVAYVRHARRGREILVFDSSAAARDAAQRLRQQAPASLCVTASYHTVIIRIRR